MLHDSILAAIRRGPLPLFVYDLAVVRERVAYAVSLLDRYYYPIKACPEPAVVRAAMESGSGLELCSAGDAAVARAVACPPHMWSFTSAHADTALLRELAGGGSLFDADSKEQILEWRTAGGSACGLRVSMADQASPYGVKFGIAAGEVGDEMEILGLHVHESHTSRTPSEMVKRIEMVLSAVDATILSQCRYINIGGGWPMLAGWPVSTDALHVALNLLRRNLAARGFSGMLVGEPGEWVVGPAGYWAASVSAVKRHPTQPHRRLVVLDTATPVPCRPSAAPFILLRKGEVILNGASFQHDIYGSANTGLDMVGSDVPLPLVNSGDVLVSLCQGAYVRSLTGSFNERPLPAVAVV
ncbi:MAG: diaminopimelate decarboxylase [Thermoanaerobaculia bacterium]|nr:diaminopimelate decarboxylase [Thermoanaerobaculia bacterium]